ncbi:hypothetical protein ACLB2K_012975 [Fragaria x ananassa]
MVARATRGSKPADDGNEETASGDNATAEVSDYEQIRDQRIKANKERMQKLGLFDLSQKLKSKPSAASKPRRRRPQKDPSDQTNPIPPLSPARRSSRLKTMAPVSYVEIRPNGKRESTWNSEINIKEGKRPEIYTDEDERLLGDCKETWELSVDGYGEDRKRIYDPVKGETCHQCRQKTLGQHTHCYKCNLVQGQFCGDCLYMRYGENVIEANKNPDWVCPVCRGICNCSLCRKEKGWEPTGNLYRKVINLGYKSVAHYLIQTRRSQPKSETSGAEESVQDDMKQETEDGQVAGEEEMEEVQPVAAKGMGNIHDTGSGVAGDSVEDVEQYGGVSRSSEIAEIPELGEPSQTIDMPDVAADAKFIIVIGTCCFDGEASSSSMRGVSRLGLSGVRRGGSVGWDNGENMAVVDYPVVRPCSAVNRGERMEGASQW